MGMSKGGYDPDGEKVNENADQHVGDESRERLASVWF